MNKNANNEMLTNFTSGELELLRYQIEKELEQRNRNRLKEAQENLINALEEYFSEGGELSYNFKDTFTDYDTNEDDYRTIYLVN